MAFRDGILVFSQPGALPAKALEQVITAVRELDMDEVRAKIAADDGARHDRHQRGDRRELRHRGHRVPADSATP